MTVLRPDGSEHFAPGETANVQAVPVVDVLKMPLESSARGFGDTFTPGTGSVGQKILLGYLRLHSPQMVQARIGIIPPPNPATQLLSFTATVELEYGLQGVTHREDLELPLRGLVVTRPCDMMRATMRITGEVGAAAVETSVACTLAPVEAGLVERVEWSKEVTIAASTSSADELIPLYCSRILVTGNSATALRILDPAGTAIRQVSVSATLERWLRVPINGWFWDIDNTDVVVRATEVSFEVQ